MRPWIIVPLFGLATMFESAVMAENNDMKAVIAGRLGWPLSAAAVDEMHLGGLSNCTIYGAYDTRIRDGVGVAVARLADGRLITTTDQGALEAVFKACVSPSTPAGTLAELLIGFSPYVGARVIHDDRLGLVRTLLRKAGAEFTPPEHLKDSKGELIRFLAVSPDGRQLFRIEGRIENGKIGVGITLLATGR